MKIYKGIDSFKKLSKAVVTTGTFDGLHLGHKKILNTLIGIAKPINAETVIVTFYPHPRIVLFPDNDLKLINTIEENIKLYNGYNIDHLIFIEFNLSFSRITSLEYIRDTLIQKIGLTDLVIGFNHHFGRNREGSVSNLTDYSDLYNFNIHEVEPYLLDKKSISSSKIRSAIINGHIELANSYLGYNFKLTGQVIKGRGVGRSLGFPTANINIKNQYKIIPKDGVYAVNVYHGINKYGGMLNIGINPTFNQSQISVEVNIFNFNKTIYEESITIEFIKRIRNEKKFDSIDGLKHQLSLDKIATLNILP